MSIILKQEESLKSEYSSRILLGLIAIIFGFLLLRFTPVLGLFFIVLGITLAKTSMPFIKGAAGEKKFQIYFLNILMIGIYLTT